MAKFEFKLQTVLKQRQAEEDRCQREVAKAMRTRMILQNQLRTMQETITQSKHDLSSSLSGAVDMQQVSHFARYSGQVGQRAMGIVQRMSVAEKQIGQARDQLLAATRGRKALDLLRDRQYAQWRRHQNVLEAAELDELAMQQYVRRSTAEFSI